MKAFREDLVLLEKSPLRQSFNKVKIVDLWLCIYADKQLKVFSTWDGEWRCIVASEAVYKDIGANIDNRWVNYFKNLSGSAVFKSGAGRVARYAGSTLKRFSLRNRGISSALLSPCNREIPQSKSIDQLHVEIPKILTRSLTSLSPDCFWYICAKCQTRLAADNSKSQRNA